MPKPGYYKRYEQIASDLGFTLTTSPRMGTPYDNFTLECPEARAALTVPDDIGKKLLEFLNTCSQSNTVRSRIAKLEQQMGELQGLQLALNELTNGNLPLYTKIRQLEQDYAMPTRGSLRAIAVGDRIEVTYYRNKQLHHKTVFCDTLRHSPYHFGQNHHFHFVLPQDLLLLEQFLVTDLEIYQRKFEAPQES